MDQEAHLIIFPLAGSVALLMQSHGSGYSGRPIYLTEPAPPVDALRLVLLARRAKVNALESGEASRSKSFWVHHDANLVTHLFGSKGRPGRLHQELRDWLRRKARHSAGSSELKEYQIAAVVATDNLLTEEEFEDINWLQLLPKRAAMPLNIAIIKAHKVYDLSGLRLRNFLADQGLRPPSASALRQRWRYLKKLLASRR